MNLGSSENTQQGRASLGVDPLVGLNYDIPVSGKWRFMLRGDVGGFGFGSDLNWHSLTRFTYQHYDLVQHGPGAGITRNS